MKSLMKVKIKINGINISNFLITLLHSDPGQTEYEYPAASAQENRQKKGMREPLLSYSEPQVEDQGYLYINIKNRSADRLRKTDRERELTCYF